MSNTINKAVKVSYEILDTPRGKRIKINTEVLEAPTQDGTLDWLYKHIECRTVTVAYLPNGVLAWVSDEGLLVSGNVVAKIGDCPLAGSIIFSLSETDDEGNTLWFDTVEKLDGCLDMIGKLEISGVIR